VGAYSTPPDLLAGSKGPTSKRKEGRKGKGRKEKASGETKERGGGVEGVDIAWPDL